MAGRHTGNRKNARHQRSEQVLVPRHYSWWLLTDIRDIRAQAMCANDETMGLDGSVSMAIPMSRIEDG